MNTEEQIIYGLLDQIRGSLINDDENISERQLRSYLRDSRAYIIQNRFGKGNFILGDEYQSIGDIDTTEENGAYIYDLPNIIKLPNNSGIKLSTIEGYNIPVLMKQDVIRAQNNFIGSHQPKAYIENNKLYIYVPLAYTSAMKGGVGIESVITSLTNRKAHLECILFNPDDQTTYDWTQSNYPLSSELINTLKANVLKQDISILLQMKTDEVTNMKQDYVRYHDQGKVD